MTDLIIKEKIIKTLLESPKTTGEIAIELGYIDDKGHGKYNIINPDLNILKQYGFIHGSKQKIKRPGAPATTYDIVYEISALSKILEKYPILISNLQRNTIISNMLVKKQQWLANPNLPKEGDLHYDIYCKKQWLEKLDLLRERDLQKHYDDDFKTGLTSLTIAGTLEEEIINFKLFLKFSPTFFKMCLMSSPGELLKIILNLDRRPISEYFVHYAERINLVTTPLEPLPNQPIVVSRFDFSNGRPLYTLIRACIFTDTLTKKDDDGVKYGFMQLDNFVQPNKIDEARNKIKYENESTKCVFFEMEPWGFMNIDKILAEIGVPK